MILEAGLGQAATVSRFCTSTVSRKRRLRKNDATVRSDYLMGGGS